MNYCDDLTDEQFLKMCQQDEDDVDGEGEGEGEGEDGGSSNLVVVPKRGRGRRPKPKPMEEQMAPVSSGYVEKNEKSKSNEDEYFEED